MATDERRTKRNQAVVKATCMAMFLLFSFLYIYTYQADLLSLIQTVLSKGQTTYNPVVGTPLIMVVLLVVQASVYFLIRLNKHYHALTYFPSMLMMGVVTSVDDEAVFRVALWAWLFPLLLVVWALIAIGLKNLEAFERKEEGKGVVTSSLVSNVVIMVLMCMMTALMGNGNDVLHYRARVEKCLEKDDTMGALKVGATSFATDANLTMLRCYALAKEGKMGEWLFRYPVEGGSEQMLPLGGTHSIVWTSDSIYRTLGAIPKGELTTRDYLRLLVRKGKATEPVKDYILCGMLIDRDVDRFAKTLPLYYAINDSLPMHYKEALVLHNHMRTTPAVVYSNTVVDTDYEDLQRMEGECGTEQERRLKAFDNYYGTYWWYYEYSNKH